MPKGRKKWTWAPARPRRMPEAVKDEVRRKASNLVECFLKPRYIKPPPKDTRFNYLVDISTKCHGRFFYFKAKYASPGPNALSPFFELGFARLEYTSADRFNLAYFRHTGQWHEVYSGLKLKEAFDLIREGWPFEP